ncbi:MAG: phenylalanine--tRNA ligase subunit alpha [Candidatus Brocadiia bacterium]
MPNIIETELESIKNSALGELEKLASPAELDQFEHKYLGRSGLLRNLTQKLGELSKDERAQAGKTINEFRNALTISLGVKKNTIQTTGTKTGPLIDFSLPGDKKPIGHLHPVYQTMAEVNNVFIRLGFESVYGPEIETPYYNFDALNIPSNHPSRDSFDTFYLADTDYQYLLRSHTSPVQIRTMKQRQPPLAVIAPGKVFRPDTPAPSRYPMFHQIEGLMVDTDISFAHLKGVLNLFTSEFFGPDTKTRFRPSFFPFTEPSAEMDISCVICGGKGTGCGLCRGEGWLEILGCGMVHPKVFEYVGYDPEKYTGFAFGIGIDRLTLLKYGINDIRLFTENHLRFLNQW